MPLGHTFSPRIPHALHRRTRTRRPRSRRTLFSLLSMMTLFPAVLAACGGSTPTVQLAKNQVFVWPYTGAGKISYDEVLDPGIISLLQDEGTISMLYTNLVTLDTSLHVQPDAALRWDVDPTGTVYTFHLRPNMRFNDGSPLTAADFAYGINRSLDATICSVLDDKTYGQDGTQSCPAPPIAQNYLGHILGANARAAGDPGSLISQGDDPNKGLNVLDPLTLRIRLDKPVAFFLQALTYSTSAPLEKAFVENPKYAGGFWVDHLDQAGTSGPFEIKSYSGGKELVLVPNTYWEQAWGKQLKLSEVDRPMYTSEDAEYSDYRAGKLDYTQVPQRDYTFARGQSDFYEIPTLATEYFGLNVQKPPFDNQQVRVAFDLALNKQLLVDRIESGAALPTNHIVPSGMQGFNSGLTNPAPDNTRSVTGNQQAALQLLTQAQAACAQGTSPAPDSCPYITGTHPKEIDIWADSDRQTNVDLITAAASTWNSALAYTVNGQQVSLNVQTKFTSDFGTLAANVFARNPNDPTQSANPYQAWKIGWVADYADPQDFLSLQFATGTPDNEEGISNANLDKALQQADEEQNVAKRMAEYNSIEQTVVSMAPWIPFQQDKFLWRQRPWVHGFSTNPIENQADIYWPDVYITAH